MTALGDGQGLLFLHGAGGGRLVWQHQVLAFPKARAPDLPGRTGDPPEGVEGYLAVLRAQLGSARDGRGRVLVGHSLGGAIALLWALRYPQEVWALILIGTGARLRVMPALLEGIRAGQAEAVEAFGAMWFATQATARLKEKSLALLRSTPRETLLADLEAADRFDIMGEVSRITQSTLVLCGADDRLTPVRFGRYLHEQIPGSDLVIVEGAGHMVMLEQPKATNSAIFEFLQRLEQETVR